MHIMLVASEVREQVNPSPLQHLFIGNFYHFFNFFYFSNSIFTPHPSFLPSSHCPPCAARSRGSDNATCHRSYPKTLLLYFLTSQTPSSSMAAATCPLVIVQTLNGDMATDATFPLPDFMKSFISPNIVNFIHSNISKSSLSRLPLRWPGSLQKHVSWQHCKININQKR